MRYSIPFVVIALILTGCNETKNVNSNSGQPAPPPTPTARIDPPPPLTPTSKFDPSYKACNPYFPLVPGSSAKYAILYSSGLVAEVTWVVDASGDGQKNYVVSEQIVDSGGGTQKLSTTKRTYVCENGNVAILSEQGDNKVDQYENTVETKFGNQAYVMPPPSDLKAGRTWSYPLTITLKQANTPPVTLDPSTRFLEYAGQEAVSVQAGKFDAVKINWRLRDKKGSDYYVRGIGLVRRIGDDGTSWELKEYSGLSYQE